MIVEESKQIGVVHKLVYYWLLKPWRIVAKKTIKTVVPHVSKTHFVCGTEGGTRYENNSNRSIKKEKSAFINNPGWEDSEEQSIHPPTYRAAPHSSRAVPNDRSTRSEETVEQLVKKPVLNR